MNPAWRDRVLRWRDALSKISHGPALQACADQIHSEHPSGVVECVELDAVLMLPRIITMALIPLDQVCEINRSR